MFYVNVIMEVCLCLRENVQENKLLINHLRTFESVETVVIKVVC